MFKATESFDEVGSAPVAQSLEQILKESGMVVKETVVLPGRKLRAGPIPQKLHGRVKEFIESEAPQGLFHHQALALQRWLDGQNLVISTATASGKTLVFAAAAAQQLLTNPEAKILVFLPLKGLAEDQRRKWEALGKFLSFRVGVIHGGVPEGDRMAILESSRVVLATPDICHAYLLNHLPRTGRHLAKVSMVILDEMATYTGVFASNAAYLFRRLSIHLHPDLRWICATATIANPLAFGRALTSAHFTLIGPEEDGSPSEEKKVVLVEQNGKAFQDLLLKLRLRPNGTFLVFSDARLAVEEGVCKAATDPKARDIQAYRAGLEEEDRARIQNALLGNGVAGVFATSALEAGIDLPHIDVVVLETIPFSVQSLLQRMGRIRGKVPGTVLIFDRDGLVSRSGLAAFLARPVEENRLYLDNRCIAFANALCAARELADTGKTIQALQAVGGWGHGFLEMVENELKPTAPLPDDLFAIKQRTANSAPHWQFPIRGAIEQSFQVELLGALRKLGVLTQSQMMREAYPGAIYRYCGDLFRVIGSRDAKILVRVEHAHFTKTTPNLQTIAFPAWTAGGQIRIAADRSGFVARTPLQISQRVIGFTERNGQHTQSHAYETGGVWAQRPLVRVFPTTGVVFTASHLPEAAGDFILRAYAFLEGIHARDLGVGPFFARSQPTGEAGEVKGLAIFDNVQGGLDLTKNLAPRFAECLTEAIRLAKLEGPENDSVVQALATLAKQVPGFVLCGMGGAGPSGSPAGADDGWIAGLIAPGEKGLVGTDEVSVLGILNGREGIRYQLARPDEPTVKWTVGKQQITPLPGSRECRFHPDTGEIQITP